MALATSASSGGPRLRIFFTTRLDRKSTRLNSSHSQISYAVFCLKKKKKVYDRQSGHTLPSDAPVLYSAAGCVMIACVLCYEWTISLVLLMVAADLLAPTRARSV